MFFTLVFFGLASVSELGRARRRGGAPPARRSVGVAGARNARARQPPRRFLGSARAGGGAARRRRQNGPQAGPGRVFRALGSTLELFVACAAGLSAFISLAHVGSPAVANLAATFSLLLAAMFGGSSSRSTPSRAGSEWAQWLSIYRSPVALEAVERDARPRAFGSPDAFRTMSEADSRGSTSTRSPAPEDHSQNAGSRSPPRGAGTSAGRVPRAEERFSRV